MELARHRALTPFSNLACLARSSAVEMELARHRALTHFVHIIILHVFTVEMELARHRAWTHFGSDLVLSGRLRYNGKDIRITHRR